MPRCQDPGQLPKMCIRTAKAPRKQGLPLLPVLFCAAEKWNSRFGRKRGIREWHGPGHPHHPEGSAELPRLKGWGGMLDDPKLHGTKKKKKKKDFLVVLWIRICLPKQGTWVRSLPGKIPGPTGQQPTWPERGHEWNKETIREKPPRDAVQIQVGFVGSRQKTELAMDFQSLLISEDCSWQFLSPE